MANRTDPHADTVHGTNPQYLVDRIIRVKIYNDAYWKEFCFGLTTESLIDRAAEMDYVAGTYGGRRRPAKFLCLFLKLLQIQPDEDVVMEYIRQPDLKYLRAVGAMYLRISARPMKVFKTLEPLLADYRKLRYRDMTGKLQLIHMDEFIDWLLREETVCDVTMPLLPKREVLEQTLDLPPRQSVLEDDLDDLDLELEQHEEKEKEKETEQAASVDEADKADAAAASAAISSGAQASPERQKSPPARERSRSPRRKAEKKRRSSSASRRSGASTRREKKDRKDKRDRKEAYEEEKKNSRRDKDKKKEEKWKMEKKKEKKEKAADDDKKPERTGPRKDKDGLSVEETNKIRAELGLKPLKK